MSWFRRIDIRIWGDSRFRTLSRPSANAQTMWMYLLTGPHTANGLPGLFSISLDDLAARLGWSKKDAERCWKEIAAPPALALADWKSHVVCVPNAVRYNIPKNDNIVKGWVREFDVIPECDLRAVWLSHVNQALAEQAPARLEQFTELFGKLLPKQSANTQTQTQTHTQTGRGTLFSTAGVLVRMPVKFNKTVPITVDQAAAWQQTYQNIDVKATLLRIASFWRAHDDAKRKTERGINISIVRWLAKDDVEAAKKPQTRKRGSASAEDQQEALKRLLETEGGGDA